MFGYRKDYLEKLRSNIVFDELKKAQLSTNEQDAKNHLKNADDVKELIDDQSNVDELERQQYILTLQNTRFTPTIIGSILTPPSGVITPPNLVLFKPTTKPIPKIGSTLESEKKEVDITKQLEKTFEEEKSTKSTKDVKITTTTTESKDVNIAEETIDKFISSVGKIVLSREDLAQKYMGLYEQIKGSAFLIDDVALGLYISDKNKINLYKKCVGYYVAEAISKYRNISTSNMKDILLETTYVNILDVIEDNKPAKINDKIMIRNLLFYMFATINVVNKLGYMKYYGFNSLDKLHKSLYSIYTSRDAFQYSQFIKQFIGAYMIFATDSSLTVYSSLFESISKDELQYKGSLSIIQFDIVNRYVESNNVTELIKLLIEKLDNIAFQYLNIDSSKLFDVKLRTKTKLLDQLDRFVKHTIHMIEIFIMFNQEIGALADTMKKLTLRRQSITKFLEEKDVEKKENVEKVEPKLDIKEPLSHEAQSTTLNTQTFNNMLAYIIDFIKKYPAPADLKNVDALFDAFRKTLYVVDVDAFKIPNDLANKYKSSVVEYYISQLRKYVVITKSDITLASEVNDAFQNQVNRIRDQKEYITIADLFRAITYNLYLTLNVQSADKLKMIKVNTKSAHAFNSSTLYDTDFFKFLEDVHVIDATSDLLYGVPSYLYNFADHVDELSFSNSPDKSLILILLHIEAWVEYQTISNMEKLLESIINAYIHAMDYAINSYDTIKGKKSFINFKMNLKHLKNIANKSTNGLSSINKLLEKLNEAELKFKSFFTF